MISWKRIGWQAIESVLGGVAMWLILTGLVFLCGFAFGVEIATLLSAAFAVNRFFNRDVT